MKGELKLERSSGTESPFELIESTLASHIVDAAPAQTGRAELVKQMSGASLGLREVSIDRSDPPIEVASLTLNPGQSKVLIGPNGAGKTTVFDTLMERGNAFANTRSGKGASLVGRPVHPREKFRISRLDQEEILDKVGDLTAREVLEHTAQFLKSQFRIDWDDPDRYEENLESQQIHSRIEILMDKVAALFDMKEFLDTPVKNLSGGERTKTALFTVLLSEPDAMLLDEPTNHLDLQSIAKLTALLEKYQEAGVAILSASHVDWFLRDAGTDGVVEIVWDKNGRRLDESKAPYERYTKDPNREQVPVIDGEIEWMQKEYGYKQGEILVTTPRVFSIPDSPLTDVSFPNVHGGEVIILSGNNGTGKTKLMEAMMHANKTGLPKKERGVHVAYLPQFWPEKVARGTLGDFFDWLKDSVDPYMTGSAYHLQNPARSLFIKLARDLKFGGASSIGESWLNKPIAKFSGGEQRILWFLAVSAMRNVDMLCLDEPTNHMDRTLQEKVARTIKSFPGAVLLSTHDKKLVTELAANPGTARGASRFPRHIVFEKRDDATKVITTEKKPVAYIDRIMREAHQAAKQFRV